MTFVRPYRMPIVRPTATLSHRRIAVGAGHIVRKTTFIQVHEGAPGLLIRVHPGLEQMPLGGVGAGMPQRFF